MNRQEREAAHELADLIGTTDIAHMAGVGVAAVSNWSSRHDDFPEPLVYISKSIPIYSRKQIVAWLVRTGRVDE